MIALLLMPLLGFSQTRRTPARSTPPSSRPEFLQQARSFESTPYVTKLVLRNGLTILVEEYRSQPVVSIQAHIHAGSLHEPEGAIGVSRLLASLIERGPGEATRGTLRQDVHALGGKLSHHVDYLDTQFEIVAPSSRWKQALNLLAGAILKADPNPDALSLEMDRVLDDARLALDDADEFAKEQLLELAFDQDRMGRYGEIVRRGLQDLKMQTLTDFYRTMYTAPKTTLVLSGDISSNEVFGEIVRLYGNTGPIATKSAATPIRGAQTSFRYRQVRGRIGLPRILLGFHAVPETAEDFRALEVLNAMLGAGEGALFNLRLKNQMGLIFAEETSLLAGRDFGYLLLRMDTDLENIDRSEIAALTEIELIKRKGPDKAELVRAQAQLELDYWKRRETVTERAAALAYYEALGNWKRPGNYIAEIKAVEPSDIKRVAQKYLRLDRCALLEYLPESESARNATVEGMRQTLEGLLESSANEEQAKREKEVVPFYKIPESKDKFSFSEVEYPFQVASILRGPDMYIREDHTSALIEMGMFFRGGKLMEKKENAGITYHMAHLMLMGTKDLPAAQFHRQLEMYGARIEPVISDDYFGFMFSVLSRNFAPAFDLLQQAIKTPNFEKDAVNRQRDIQKKKILVRRNSGAFALDQINQALFHDFPYSRNDLGTDAGVAAITDASILEWHSEYVRNRKPYVVIVGDTRGTSLAAHFVKHFSGSRIQEARITEEWAKPLDKSETVEQSWNKDDSLILIGFQAAPLDDEDGAVIRVLEKLIGNRDQPSTEDGAIPPSAGRLFATYNPRWRGGSFIVGAFAKPENEAGMLNKLKREIQQVVSGPNSYRDVRSAVSAAGGGYRIMCQMRSEQIREITKFLLAGRGVDGFLNLPGDVQMIKEQDLSEIAPKALDMQKAVILLMHGRPN